MTVLSKIAHALRMLAGVIVVVLVLITGYDVIMRYVFALPLDWSITISSVGLIAIIMLAIPDVALRGEHIAMDLFTASSALVCRRLPMRLSLQPPSPCV